MKPGTKILNLVISTVACCLVVVSPSLALAASTDISDIPLAVKNMVQPNIMFTLDNSGSMSLDYMPDGIKDNKDKHCFRNSVYNKVYYDPNITYVAGVDASGASLGDSTFTSAWKDGYHAYDGVTGKTNLSTSFRTGSDWRGKAAYYYIYSGKLKTPDPSTCYADTDYTKVVVSTTSGTGGSNEKQNFANWYSYYRTRILVMKTSLGRAFQALSSHYRVGFSTINDNNSNTNSSGANFVPVGDFDATQKTAWYGKLYSIKPGGYTPLRRALDDVGQYYQTGTMPGASSADPIQYSCQRNYAILSTDGFWNRSAPSGIDDRDETIPKLPEKVSKLTAGDQWPRPFWQGPTATSDTLADVAMKYWATDLRTTGATASNNVQATSTDPATWQHMDTYTIGLAAGTKPYRSDYLDPDVKSGFYYDLTQGTDNWPVPVSNDATTIDDLWHAAVNGHGTFLQAQDPVAISNGLAQLLQDITGDNGSAAAVAVSNTNVVAGDNYSYASSYNSGTWAGDLNAYPIDVNKGTVDSSKPIWTNSAQKQLDGITDVSTRHIATYSGSAGVAFNTASLPSAMQTLLDSPVTPPGPGDWKDVLNYLRGDQGKEKSTYRIRTSILGDIVDAEPIVVGPPSADFSDPGYADFKTAYASREPIVYQGANDGMLHAFTAPAGANASSGGAEAWAYVPGLLFNQRLSKHSGTSTLVNLTSRNGFTHLFYVDGTPVARDVDFNYTEPATGTLPDPTAKKYSPGWHTILVGGLRSGGRGYYALDITNPSAGSDADVAAKVLWEFPNDATATTVKDNIGLSFGRPIVVKTKAAGWVVLVTSGYNNGADTKGDGQGHLFVLNAKTGALLADISTGAGTSADPSGLAHISAYARNWTVDNTTDYVYGGDLQGNVWRFDLSGTIKKWNVVKLASLTGPDDKAQAVTTEPELAEVDGRRMVYVGTGKYLGDSDIPSDTNTNSSATQTQTMYGLVDNMTTKPLITKLRSGSLVKQTFTTDKTTRTASKNSVDLSAKQGWYIDLPASGERVITDPALAVGALTFTTNIPSTDACTPGGSSWFNVLDYKTGGFITGSTVKWSSTFLGDFLASRPQAIKLSDGTIKVLVRTSTGEIKSVTVPIPSSSVTGKRTSWREIILQ